MSKGGCGWRRVRVKAGAVGRGAGLSQAEWPWILSEAKENEAEREAGRHGGAAELYCKALPTVPARP